MNKYLIALTYLFSQGQVRQKVSSRGKYVSVNIGPVQVVSSEQVFLSLKHIKDMDEISAVAFYWKAKGKGKKG
jgi:putative lipoic acid-binding regulatory protein